MVVKKILQARPAHEAALPWSWESRKIIFLICASYLLIPLTLTGISSSLELIKHDIHATSGQTLLIVSGYSAAFAGTILLWGALADHYGAKPIFLIGVTLFAICSLFSGITGYVFPGAFSGIIMDAIRIVAGFAAGATLTGSVTLIARNFSGKQRIQGFGAFGFAVGCGFAFGPTISGFIIDYVSWRAVFFVFAVLGLIFALGLQQTPLENDAKKGSIDIVGGVILTSSFLAIVLAIVNSAHYPYTAGVTWIPLVVGLALLVGFRFYESRSKASIIEFASLRTPSFLIACVGAVSLLFYFAALVIYLPQYFQNLYHNTTTQTGLLMIIFTGPYLVVPIFFSRLHSVFSLTSLAIASLVITGIGFGVFGLALLPAWAGILIAGIGIGMNSGLLESLALQDFRSLGRGEGNEGAILGVFNTTKMFAEALGITIVGAILSNYSPDNLGPALRSILFVGSILLFIAAIIVVLIRQKYKPHTIK